MAFLCFFCKETDVIEWHDVEDGCLPYQPPRRSCRASTSGSGLQVNRGQSSSPSYRTISQTVDEPQQEEEEVRGTYSPPKRVVNNRSRPWTNKRVRFMKVDIRVPRQEGTSQGTKKVVRLVKIDIRPGPDDDTRREEQLGVGIVASSSEGWPFKQRLKPPTTREIREGSESPDVGFFNSPNREGAAKIMRLNQRHQQEIQEGFDIGSSPSSGRAFKQRPTRPRQHTFQCEASTDVFGESPNSNKVWPDTKRRNRPRNEIFERPNNRSGGSRGWQSPNRSLQESCEIAVSRHGTIRSLQSPNRHEREANERVVSHSWALRGLESPNQPAKEIYKRAMSHSGALRGLQSPNRPGQESYERAMSHSGALRGLQSPNRTLRETYERAMHHSGALRGLQSPNRAVQETYNRGRSHSWVLRGLQSPNGSLHETYERAITHSGAIRSLQSPNRNLQDFYERSMSHRSARRSSQSPNRSPHEIDERPLSHSGAIRRLQSPDRNSGGEYRSSQSPNRPSQDMEGEFGSSSPGAGSQLNSPS